MFEATRLAFIAFARGQKAAQNIVCHFYLVLSLKRETCWTPFGGMPDFPKHGC